MISADVPVLISQSPQQTIAFESELVRDEDVAVEKLVLDVVKSKKLDFDVTKSILDARVRETMTGAPVVTLSLHDPELHLLTSDVLWEEDKDGDRELRDIEITVDGRQFVLMSLEWAPSASGAGVDLTLIFEHKLVVLLRRHRKPKIVSRTRITLPEFIRTFAREIKSMDVRFVSPGLHKALPISKKSQDDSSDSNRDVGLDNDVIYIKKKRATTAQRKVVDAVLKAGHRLDVSSKLLIVAIMVITQESSATTSATNGIHVGPFQQNPDYGSESARRDPFTSATAFFRKAKAQDKAHPSLGYAELGEAVQISGQGSLYAQWKEEATNTVKEFGGTGGESRTYKKRYNYTRGTDGKKESSWAASQRYAELVNYRSFVTGKQTWYFISEPDLFKSRARMTISPGSDAVLGAPTAKLDKGKKVRSLSISILMRRWQAPPGSVVKIKGYGPADGRWLVEDIERSLYSKTGEVTLKKPTKPKAEPANETETVTSSEREDAKGVLGKLVQDARKFKGPYVYGGGHGPSLSSLGYSQGLDCSSSVCKWLWDCGLFNGSVAIVSGAFNTWGEAGEGRILTVWYHGGHVWAEFHVNGRYYRFDTSSYGSGGSGPRLRTTRRPTAGFQPRHPKGM